MEIVENNRNYLKDFIRLNEEWISTYFQIEDIDRELAANPQKVISQPLKTQTKNHLYQPKNS
ncbi:MAG: hypothetical protein HFP77_03900 [Methylococcales symbiont of Iophon sp. n. MRB-2018]|nr:MAG: hypothetical protein HFP77_03900 [Methylococcales symbiont of Iophon sp. n. MRB-2018]KAF3980246.1 MAG: hypothetical protein HFP76_02980 [Methylococcales symbiont of Iophon sp. n. MRB-2018]